MLEFVIPFLLALGFFILVILLIKQLPEKRALGLLIFSIGLIGLSFFLTIILFGILTIIKKMIGILILLIGFFLVIKFPRPDEYQPPSFSTLGLFIGFLFLFFGFYLALF